MSALALVSPSRRPLQRQGGFSLIEILVGMVIAMIGVAIMTEVLLTSDQRTRSTTAGNEALSSGAVMSHLIERDLVQAGFGINSPRLLGCNLELRPGVVVPLAPVTINPPTTVIPAGDANTDRLLIVYGSDNGQPEGQQIRGIQGAGYGVGASSALADNDYVVAAPPTCAGNLKLARVVPPRVNYLVNVDVLDPAAVTGILYNLGRAPHIVAYAVRGGSLTSCDFMVSNCSSSPASAANWTAVAGNIVSLRAQYGRDTAAAGAMDGIVDTWVTAPAPPAAPLAPMDACALARTPAVRFALVARSSQFESHLDPTTKQRVCEPVTHAGNAPRWEGSLATPNAPVPAPLDLSADAEWQCYRYRTFETVAPSRNINWIRTPASC
ncbi:hypothetical protein GCM10028796_54260 [Ramlibacter monticola]|uniref:PilW family protein n=1 Tax=Ramlibacter monticola TaxID=1926872 RepID=A0A936Z9D8_9BURK|nr:prepilin-type N-terminal cleavage/methylation domain-containing protein [Ramlibacter monticola]MBL0394856.1 PilW family protein [Ramlibacter monticola]